MVCSWSVGTQYVAGTIGTNFAKANQSSSCALPTTINFNNTTTGTNICWDFGDGTTSTAINPSHTYAVNGTYSVKLVATGCGRF